MHARQEDKAPERLPAAAAAAVFPTIAARRTRERLEELLDELLVVLARGGVHEQLLRADLRVAGAGAGARLGDYDQDVGGAVGAERGEGGLEGAALLVWLVGLVVGVHGWGKWVGASERINRIPA